MWTVCFDVRSWCIDKQLMCAELMAVSRDLGVLMSCCR